MRSIFFILFFTMILADYGKAHAHPHAFVDCDVEFVFDQQGLKEIAEVWHFDDMTSLSILRAFDANENNILEPKELASIREMTFPGLMENGFYNHIQINGAAVNVPEPSHFSAQVKDGKLTYRLVFSVAAKAGDRMVFGIFDKSYYSDMFIPTSGVHYKGVPANIKVSHEIDMAPSLAYYGGQIVPDAITMDIKPK